MDKDESYIITMGIRLLNGDRLFDTMWELHMTSAWPAYLGLAFYRAMTGTLEGSALFLRLLSVLCQFFTGWVTYHVIKKYQSRHTAVLAGIFVANFLPRATQNLEYGLLQMLFVILAVLLLYDEVMCADRKNDGVGRNVWSIFRVAGAGILYSLGVLAYPTIILSFPVLLAALYFAMGKCLPVQKSLSGSDAHGCSCGGEKMAGRWRSPVLFALVCGICALIFLAYVLSYLSVEEFMRNLQGMLMDGTHSDTVKTHTYINQIIELIKRTVLIGAAAGGCYLCGYKWEKDRILLWYDILLAGSLIFIGFNITGLRPSGPIGLQIRYILAVVAALVFALKMKSKVIGGLFLLPGIVIYVGAMIGSNMGFEENASFLYLAVLAAVLLLAEYAGKRGGRFGNIGYFCVGCFVFGLIFGKGYLVRVTGTLPANITEERVRIEEGVFSGIYVYPEEAETYAVKEREMRENSHQEDVVLYLGNDAICNTFTEGSFTSATCISTPVYNEEWVLYYENEKHPQPTVVFLDKDIIKTVVNFEESAYGAWLMERYGLTEEDFEAGEAFYILRLEERHP